MSDGSAKAMKPTNRPLVSVLIPCFNHERYLEQCLDSVLADGYDNLELRFIDDGSSDRSFALAQAWGERNQHHFRGGIHMERQPNQGLIATLNRLVEQSHGDYFALLASDDMLLPGGIQARVDHLLAHSRHFAVAGDAEGMDENGIRTMPSVVRGRHHGDPRTLASESARTMELILNWSIPGAVYLARREVVDAVGWYEKKFFVEDREYFLRLLAKGAVGFIDRTVGVYRMHSQSQGGSLANRTRMAVEIARVDTHALPWFEGWRRAALALRIASYMPYWRERARTTGGLAWGRVIMSYPARVLVLIWRDLNRLWARFHRK